MTIYIKKNGKYEPLEVKDKFLIVMKMDKTDENPIQCDNFEIMEKFDELYITKNGLDGNLIVKPHYGNQVSVK